MAAFRLRSKSTKVSSAQSSWRRLSRVIKSSGLAEQAFQQQEWLVWQEDALASVPRELARAQIQHEFPEPHDF